MNLFYRESGEGTPLLILHGLFGCADNWNQMAKKLSAHVRVITLDLRNHGLSPHSEEWDYHSMAADVVEVCEKLDLQQVVILGHSMGGKVAMYLAALAPQLLRGMVVVDIAPRYYPPHHHEVLQALWESDPSEALSRKTVEEALRKTLKEEAVVQFLLKNLYWKEMGEEKKLAWRMNLETITTNIAEVGAASPLPPKDFTLHCPVLFVKGSLSDYINEKDESDILNRYPGAEIISIEKAGHWVQAEQPESFYTCIVQWMQNNRLL